MHQSGCGGRNNAQNLSSRSATDAKVQNALVGFKNATHGCFASVGVLVAKNFTEFAYRTVPVAITKSCLDQKIF